MRNIDITKKSNKIRCKDRFLFEDDGSISVSYEIEFDVDEYFGTNINSTNDKCLTFYTFYHIDGDITAAYTIESQDDFEFFYWELTEEEKKFFRFKMETYYRYLYNGKTIVELMDDFT